MAFIRHLCDRQTINKSLRDDLHAAKLTDLRKVNRQRAGCRNEQQINERERLDHSAPESVVAKMKTEKMSVSPEYANRKLKCVPSERKKNQSGMVII